MIRYGKSAEALLAHKQDFFRDNDNLLREGRRIGDIYRAQPARTACKCCATPLAGASFVKQGITYIVCGRCGHLNGAHEDSAEFCTALYTEAGGAAYAKTYSADDRDAYRRRVQDIYVPKAEFLRDALAEAGHDAAALRYADLGAGSGYFVAAMRELGFSKAVGYEASEVQSGLANAMIGEGAVRRHELDDVVSLASALDADVVSMIGVLEHVREPRELLTALQANTKVGYLYLSVPLFSACVFFEMVFPDVFQRQLSAAHTHLYTESSLDWTCREFGMTRAAEWWFGTDMVDLFRALSVRLEKNSELNGMSDHWARIFAPAIDGLQLALDRKKLSSEVHMLLRFVS